MSEYLAYTLWRQHEERLPREMERARVARERAAEQAQEAEASRKLDEELELALGSTTEAAEPERVFSNR